MSKEIRITDPEDEITINGYSNEEIGEPFVSEDQVISGKLETPKAVKLDCLSFFSAGIGRLGIRNNCSECKKAVVMWNQGVGIRLYRVNGHNQIIVNILAQHGQLIGEDPC